jgi:hypothetical protein
MGPMKVKPATLSQASKGATSGAQHAAHASSNPPPAPTLATVPAFLIRFREISM